MYSLTVMYPHLRDTDLEKEDLDPEIFQSSPTKPELTDGICWGFLSETAGQQMSAVSEVFKLDSHESAQLHQSPCFNSPHWAVGWCSDGAFRCCGIIHTQCCLEICCLKLRNFLSIFSSHICRSVFSIIYLCTHVFSHLLVGTTIRICLYFFFLVQLVVSVFVVLFLYVYEQTYLANKADCDLLFGLDMVKLVRKWNQGTTPKTTNKNHK